MAKRAISAKSKVFGTIASNHASSWIGSCADSACALLTGQ